MRLSTTLVASLLISQVAAQVCVLQPRIGTVTECFPYNSGRPPVLTLGPTPVVQSPVETGQPVIITVEAPVCHSCGCNGAGCQATTVYETTFLSLCTTAGLTSQVYTVTETYSGVSPTLNHQPPAVQTSGLPFGFMTTLKSCTVCNPPVTAVITCPVTTYPYVTGLSKPSPAPAGMPPYEIHTTQDTLPGETGSFDPGLGNVGGESEALDAGSWPDSEPEGSCSDENMDGWSGDIGSSGSAGGNNNIAGGSSGWGSSSPTPPPPPPDTGSSPGWPGGYGPEHEPSESSSDSILTSSPNTASLGNMSFSRTSSATSSTSTSVITAAAPRSLAPFLEGILFGLLVAYTFILQ